MRLEGHHGPGGVCAALLALLFLAPGCASPTPEHVVYVQGHGQERLVFEIRVEGDLVRTVTWEDGGDPPDVIKAYEREARRERTPAKTFTITETTLNLTRSVEVPTGMSRHILARVDANDTLEVRVLDAEPTFG